MKMIIEIAMGKAAFHDRPSGSEVARILRQVASQTEEFDLPKGQRHQVMDVNGNTVGFWKTTTR